MELFTFKTAHNKDKINRLVEKSEISNKVFFPKGNNTFMDKSKRNKNEPPNAAQLPSIQGTENRMRREIKKYWKALRLSNSPITSEMTLKKEHLDEMVDDMIKMPHANRRQYLSDYILNLSKNRAKSTLGGE
jgi:hypothetical protein